MKPKTLIPLALALALALAPAVAAAKKLNVVTSLTDLAWVTERIGGDRVMVTPLLTGKENPHFMDVVPEHVRLIAAADALCYAGIQLEIGWLPRLIARSGNKAVGPGGRGHCETGTAVRLLDAAPAGEHPSLDTIHPSGNPHFWLSPERLSEAAGVVGETLSRLAPEHAAEFAERLTTLRKELSALLEKNRARLKPIAARFNHPFVIEYHKEFSYFDEAYGLNCLGTIEEKPGIPPSAGRIAEVAARAKALKVRVAFAADYAPRQVLKRFTELSGIPVLTLPLSTGRKNEKLDYVAFQESLVEKVAAFFAEERK